MLLVVNLPRSFGDESREVYLLVLFTCGVGLATDSKLDL
jgi:hypothetical protein